MHKTLIQCLPVLVWSPACSRLAYSPRGFEQPLAEIWLQVQGLRSLFSCPSLPLCPVCHLLTCTQVNIALE